MSTQILHARETETSRWFLLQMAKKKWHTLCLIPHPTPTQLPQFCLHYPPPWRKWWAIDTFNARSTPSLQLSRVLNRKGRNQLYQSLLVGRGFSFFFSFLCFFFKLYEGIRKPGRGRSAAVQNIDLNAAATSTSIGFKKLRFLLAALDFLLSFFSEHFSSIPENCDTVIAQVLLLKCYIANLLPLKLFRVNLPPLKHYKDTYWNVSQ